MQAGVTKLVVTTPEQLDKEGVRAALRKLGVACVWVDEAHCVGSWAGFRPSYGRLGPNLL